MSFSSWCGAIAAVIVVLAFLAACIANLMRD